MKIYSGDTFKQDVQIYYYDGNVYQLKKGDIFLCSFVDFKNDVFNEKKQENLTGDKITIEYTAEEMEKLSSGNYIFQMKIITEEFSQTNKVGIEIERGYRNAR